MKTTGPHASAENIATVAKLEKGFLEGRSRTERVADAIASFAGTISFIVLHIATVR
jgi:uncharacterized membrane protein